MLYIHVALWPEGSLKAATLNNKKNNFITH